MTELYVFDFDGTLIGYDSFRRFIKGLIRICPIKVGLILVRRVFRLISSTELKREINHLVNTSERCTLFARDYAKIVIKDVRWTRKCPIDGLPLIISASPMCYMKYIGELLGVNTVASEENVNGNFVNMYGKEKLRYLSIHFPSIQYVWKYAASDSKSDYCWMKQFNEYEIIKR